MPQHISLANQNLGFNTIKAIDLLAMFVLTAIFVYKVFFLNSQWCTTFAG